MTRQMLGCADGERAAANLLNRRGVLGRALGAGAAGALTGLVSEGLSTRLAFASGAYTGDTLVVLSLHGGFDGLSAVAPIGDPNYYRARPTLALPKSRAIAGDAMFGLHPAMAPLLPLWRSGDLAAVHAVGQPNPTRSHFAAMEELERAAPGTSLRTGWLDRVLGVDGRGGPFAGVSLGDAMPARILAGPSPSVSMTSVDGLTLAGDGPDRPMAAALRSMYAGTPQLLAGPARAADAALTAAAGLRDGPAYRPAHGADYPGTPLGAALRDVARLIKSRVGLRAAAVDCGDWDMHEGLGAAVEGQWMYDNLADTASALAAFAADLGPAGMADVTLVTVSEFGRRVQENGSGGTDHGHGNAMLLMGGGLRGGRVYGRWPGLSPADLVAGDLAAVTDYRSVIGELLQQRCGFGALGDVFPGVEPTRLALATARA